ncbi:hypothetical protein Tco_0971246 [Tanacetum coccineum]
MKTSERAMQGFELASELDLANEIIDNWRIKRTVNHICGDATLGLSFEWLCITFLLSACHRWIKSLGDASTKLDMLIVDVDSPHSSSGMTCPTADFISPHEVQNETGDTRTNELRNEIEKSKKEKDRVIAREIFLVSTLTEINHRILKVDDEYKTTQQASEVLLEAQMLERVALLEAQMEKMDPNLNSISDYREKLSKYNERVEELTLVTKECDKTKKHYNGLEKEKYQVGFNIISLKLKEVYQMITLGGDAELNIFEVLLC